MDFELTKETSLKIAITIVILIYFSTLKKAGRFIGLAVAVVNINAGNFIFAGRHKSIKPVRAFNPLLV